MCISQDSICGDMARLVSPHDGEVGEAHRRIGMLGAEHLTLYRRRAFEKRSRVGLRLGGSPGRLACHRRRRRRANIAPAGFLLTRIFRRYIDHRRPSIGLDHAVILQDFQQRRVDLLGRHRLELARRRVANRGFFLFTSFNLVLL